MTIYYRLSIFTKKERALYHNPVTKQTFNVTYGYIGIEGKANTFTGIESVTTLDNKPVKDDHSAAFSYSSQFCGIFPIVEVLSAVAFAIIFYINFSANNIAYLFGSLVIFLIFSLAIFILNKYLEKLFLDTIPKKGGWARAYIDDYGDLSYPDEKTGKVVHQIVVTGGKKRISFVTQEESDRLYNAFFGKDGAFNKKNKS